MNAAAERCSPGALPRGGRDASGVTGYLESWLAAFEESRNGSSAWPRMLLASTRDVYATRCVDAWRRVALDPLRLQRHGQRVELQGRRAVAQPWYAGL